MDLNELNSGCHHIHGTAKNFDDVKIETSDLTDLLGSSALKLSVLNMGDNMSTKDRWKHT